MSPSMRFSDADQFARSDESEYYFISIGTHLQQLHTARNEQEDLPHRIPLAKDRVLTLEFLFASCGDNLFASSRGSA